MSSSCDYFQLAFYENSGSDGEVQSVTHIAPVNGTTQNSVNCQNELVDRKISMTSAECDTDTEMARSFVLRGWAQVEVYFYFFIFIIFHFFRYFSIIYR